MKRVLIVHASTKGHTFIAAEAHAEGAAIAGCDPQVLSADEMTPGHIEGCDALVLGSPVHMGAADWRMKRFIDTVCGPLWMKDSLIGKVGGVFATGGGYGNAGGGVDLCLVGMFCNLAQLGFLMVPLPRNSPGFEAGGTPWGPYCRSQRPDLSYAAIDAMPIQACVAHGFNIATVARGVDRSALTLADRSLALFTGRLAPGS